ncbi:MAG TPA: NfeD family protein [Candidatus Marinimicrobia bacterium]|nr:NfeD family protein [Candidatus Neomarinimicrobiota bacterium]
MEIFQRPEVAWFLVGLVCILAEFVLPGVVIIFFGIGAWVTAFLLLIFSFSFGLQVLFFVLASVISLLTLRKRLNRVMALKPNVTAEMRSEGFLGETAVCRGPLLPGKIGKVEYKGAIWEAWSDEAIETERLVTIIDVDSIKLKVKAK